MKPHTRIIAQGAVFVAAVLLTLGVETFGVKTVRHNSEATMRAAEALATRWFDVIGDFKEAHGLVNDEVAHVRFGSMLGDDFTDITTTLGSLSAKETATNPQFGALMVRLLADAGIDSSSTVGIIMSASFPGLGIATLAAAQSLGCRVVLLSSLGSSTYGANQPEATWPDMESLLREQGGLRYRSEMVTPGAESDRGEGLSGDGLRIMADAAKRNDFELFYPTSLSASIATKTRLLIDRKVDLLVNIGGNEAALGSCAHAVSLPNGFHDKYRPCSCPERGVIAHLAEHGTPFIHLLYVRDLAVRYGVSLDSPGNGDELYLTRRVSRVMVTGSLAILAVVLVSYRHRRADCAKRIG